MRKFVNSVVGARLLGIAISLASSLRLGTQTKRRIIDGFIVEGKVLNGNLRTASVIDTPQVVSCVWLGIEPGFATRRYAESYSVSSRDFYYPLANTGIKLQYSKKTDLGFYIILSKPPATNFYHTLAPIIMQKGFICTYTSSAVSVQPSSPGPLGDVLLGVLSAGTQNPSVLSIVSDWQYLGSLLGGSLNLPAVHIKNRSSVSETSENASSQQKTSSSPIVWWDNGACALIPVLKQVIAYPWRSDLAYTTYTTKLALTRTDKNRFLYLTHDIRGMLPEWARSEKINLTSLWATGFSWYDYREVGVHRYSVDNMLDITLKSARVIEDDGLDYTKGTLVVAATVRTFIPVHVPWGTAEGYSEEWHFPVLYNKEDVPRSYEIWCERKTPTSGPLCHDREEALGVLIAVKIVVKGMLITEVEVLDTEILAAKQTIKFCEERGDFEAPFPYEEESFSVDFMMDVFNDGKVLLRKKILDRPNTVGLISSSSELRRIDTFANTYSLREFSLAPPYYKASLDGEEIFASEAMGVENQAIHYTGGVNNYLSRNPRRSHHTHSVRVSKETTMLQWYESRTDNEMAKPGVLFTDGIRFRKELDGYAEGIMVGVSCPQEEVRDKSGALVMPSTILATIYKGGAYQYMVRKGPIWPEDESDKFDHLKNERMAESMKWWSNPAPLHPGLRGYGVLMCRGSLAAPQTHGEFFSNEVRLG